MSLWSPHSARVEQSPSRIASVQQHFVPLRSIVGNDTLCLSANGDPTGLPRDTDRYSAVVTISSINFGLRADEEQEIIINSFREFVNQLTFPLQILIRIQPLDLEPYLRGMQQRADQLRVPLQTGDREAAQVLAQLTDENMAFIRSLAQKRRLLERHFYLIVPATAVHADEPLFIEMMHRFLQMTKRQSASDVYMRPLHWQGVARQQLDLRVSEIGRQMGRMGLEIRRLHGAELATFYASCFDPQRAAAQPITEEQLTATSMPTLARAPRSWLPHRRQRASAPVTQAPVDPESAVQDAFSDTDEQPPAKIAPWSWIRKIGEKKEHSVRVEKTEQTDEFLSLADLIAPASVALTPTALTINNEHLRVLAVTGFPRHIYPGWLAQIIGLDVPMDISLHLQPRESTGMIRRLTRKLTEFHSSEILDQRNGRMPDAERSIARNDVERLRDFLQRGDERVFAMSLYLMVRAPSLRALDERASQVRAVLDSLLLVSHPASYEQDLAVASCLPSGRDHLRRSILLDTSSVATAFPFVSSTLSMDDGILFGVTGDGGIVLIDQFSPVLENANQVVFAKSGAGKSYAIKVQALRSLIRNTAVVIIDPENEYPPLCQAVGGVYVRLAPGSRQHINPFDLYAPTAALNAYAAMGLEMGDPLAEKVASLHTFFDLLLAEHALGHSTMLTQREKSFLEKCTYETYRRAGITADPVTHRRTPPLLKDFYTVLQSGDCGKDEFGLGDRLYRFVFGSMSQIFAAPTNVALNNPMVVFNIRDMGGEMKPIGLYLIAEFVYTRMRYERHRQPRLLIIDEAWTLMQYQEGGRFISDLARRGRKYHLGLVTVTQDVADFLSNPSGATVLAQASIKLLMKQDATTIPAVSEAFRLSQGERQFLLSCNKGEGLLFLGGAHIAIRVEASEREHQLVTTNPRELAALAALQDAALPTSALPTNNESSEESPVPRRRRRRRTKSVSPLQMLPVEVGESEARRNGQYPAVRLE